MKLKQIREVYGFKQKQMAELLCLNRNTYVHYETGRREIPAIVAQRIERKFDLEAVAKVIALRHELLLAI